MNVIFLQDVPEKAHAGEVKRVADGYARNYLLPKGLAEVVTPEIMKRVNKIKSIGDAQRLRETETMEVLAQLLFEKDALYDAIALYKALEKKKKKDPKDRALDDFDMDAGLPEIEPVQGIH